MPPANPKNASLGAAAFDLGLGMPLDDQILDEEERRKRLKEGKAALPSQYGDSVLGTASMALFSGMAGRR